MVKYFSFYSLFLLWEGQGGDRSSVMSEESPRLKSLETIGSLTYYV